MSLRLIFVSAVSAATLAACATRQENPIYKYSSTYKASSPYTTVAANETASVQTTPVSFEAQPSAVIPASQQTRIVNECRMSAGVETCRAVEIPVSAIQTQTAQPIAIESYSQNDYLIQTSAQTSTSQGHLTQVDSECVQAGAVVPCFPVEIPITTQTTVSQPYYAQPEIIMAGADQSSAQVITSTDTQYGGDFTGTPGYYAVQNDSVDFLSSDEIEFITPPADNVIEAATGNGSQFADSFISSDGAMLHHVTEGDTLYSLARKSCTSVPEIQSMNNIDANFSIKVGDNIRLPASRC